MTNSRSRVLVVDDEVFFREAISEILTNAGFRVNLAEDGESALESVTDTSIGAVVLDVRLPGIDGIQVLARVRERRPDLPVIMLSSSTDQEIVLEALRLGAHDYLAKPLHDEELVLAVGRALDGHEVSAEQTRLRGRIERLVVGMEHLSQLVRLAQREDRVSVLRQGIVDTASGVLQAQRVSLMLADASQELLSVVASRGSEVALETMSPRKNGEGASGTGFSEGAVLCVPEADKDDRFAGRSAGVYESPAFAIVPLICLGLPVGVLCVTQGHDDGEFFIEEPNVLRLLGMQISEFLAADPEVDKILTAASQIDVEGLDAFASQRMDPDAELARVICEAIASETEPTRMLARALSSVSSQLNAAPVSLFLLSPNGEKLEIEAEFDGGLVSDRREFGVNEGLAGSAAQSGRLVAVEDPSQDARFSENVDTASDGQTRPYLCLPLRLRDKVVGLLRVFLEPGATASPRTAEVLAAGFSAALRNVLLYRSLLQSIEEVAQARREARS